ncbi:hypothetical protein BH18ACT12_BH18ACT12_14120 [soil metagenome]
MSRARRGEVAETFPRLRPAHLRGGEMGRSAYGFRPAPHLQCECSLAAPSTLLLRGSRVCRYVRFAGAGRRTCSRRRSEARTNRSRGRKACHLYVENGSSLRRRLRSAATTGRENDPHVIPALSQLGAIDQATQLRDARDGTRKPSYDTFKSLIAEVRRRGHGLLEGARRAWQLSGPQGLPPRGVYSAARRGSRSEGLASSRRLAFAPAIAEDDPDGEQGLARPEPP